MAANTSDKGLWRSATWLAFAMALAVAVFAPRAADAQPNGSITVSTQAEAPNGSITLTGDTFAIAKVASAEVAWDYGTPSVSYSTDSAFSELGISWSNATAEDLRYAAHTANRIAALGELYRAEQTVGKGQAAITFSGLDPGVYVMARTRTADSNRSVKCAPSLVSVPEVENGSATYDVSVTPKFEWAATPDQPGSGDEAGNDDTAKPPASSHSRGFMPQTGDYLVMGTIALALAAGIAFIALGRLIRRK